ncbi:MULTISPECIES: hypothetical protein [Flavobacteriaceae]|uniref:hypothetical protein n=1 Tax=Flavobacteriaceae TaxID=49546 RepID=UPI001491DE75|nr:MULTISPECIES: hypothetical protein [Allomuricauda]MDC6367202.1 hypothetical protein [Muricauda sp. AC10]
MKTKLLVSLVIFGSFYQGFCQMVVNDTQANASLLKQIAQSVKTVEQTTKTVKLLKETKEMYDDINSALQTFGYITDMTNVTTQILQNTGSFLKEIQATNMFSDKEMGIISGQFSRGMERGNTILKVANDLLSGGIFKMNDAERLALLKQSRQELNEALIDTRISRKKYLRIAEKRALRQYFANSKNK